MNKTTQQLTLEAIQMINETVKKKPVHEQARAREELFKISETQLLVEIARLAECIDGLRREREGSDLIIRVLHDFPVINKLSSLQQMIKENKF